MEAEVRFTADRALSYSVTSIRAIKTSRSSTQPAAYGSCYRAPCVLAWAESDQVSIVSNGQVQVLVEKDFQCLHGADRREPDAWPNPLAEPQNEVTGALRGPSIA